MLFQRLLPALLWIATALAAMPAHADDEAVWGLLQRGGNVVMIRHAVTTPGVGDPEGFQLRECATQRNLSDEGRAHAARLGEALRARGVVIDRVISSPWCRCLDTARLLFPGRPVEVSFALGNLFGRSDIQARQLADLRPLAGAAPGLGANKVLVTHGSTTLALTGLSPGTAEMVVLTPQPGGRFSVAGRLQVP